MPNQEQVTLFKQVFEGYQNGIDPNEYNAERRDTLVERKHPGFWLKNYNDDKPCATAEIYQAGQSIGNLLFSKGSWDQDGTFVILQTGDLRVEASASHAASIIDRVIKRVAAHRAVVHDEHGRMTDW